MTLITQHPPDPKNCPKDYWQFPFTTIKDNTHCHEPALLGVSLHHALLILLNRWEREATHQQTFQLFLPVLPNYIKHCSFCNHFPEPVFITCILWNTRASSWPAKRFIIIRKNLKREETNILFFNTCILDFMIAIGRGDCSLYETSATWCLDRGEMYKYYSEPCWSWIG